MKSYQKNIILVISFALLAVLFISCAKRGVKNIDSKGENIICFGDSITLGYGANIGEDYPCVLAKLINKSVLNMGVDGETSEEALKRLKPDVLDREPLLVIIEFGGNDFLRKIPKETTMRNVKEMVGIIHANGAMVAIVDISAGMFLSDYREEFSKLAKEEGVIFVPNTLNGIITNPSMKSDFLHPNGAGYKLIAQQVSRAIKPYLEHNFRLNKPRK